MRYSTARCGTRRVPTGRSLVGDWYTRQLYRIPRYSAVLPPGCALHSTFDKREYRTWKHLQTWGPKPGSARGAPDDELTRTSPTLGRARVSLNLTGVPRRYPGVSYGTCPPPPTHSLRPMPCCVAPSLREAMVHISGSPTGSFADCICSAFERERRLEAVAAGRSSSHVRSAMSGFPRPRRRMCGHGSKGESLFVTKLGFLRGLESRC